MQQEISQADRAIGSKLAAWLQSNSDRGANLTMLQGMVADLVGERSELIVPLKDLVCRPSFQALVPLAGSGRGHLQRDALLQEVSRTFAPSVVAMVADVLSGFLAIPAGSTAAGASQPASTDVLRTSGMGAPASGAPVTLMADDTPQPAPAAAATPPSSSPTATPTSGNGVSNRLLIGIAILCALLTTGALSLLRSSAFCGVIGLCPGTTEATAPSGEAGSSSTGNPTGKERPAGNTAPATSLSQARQADSAMRSADSLSDHERSLRDLEQALSQLESANLSPAETEERRALLQSAEQGRQLLQEEQRHSSELQRLSTMLTPQNSSASSANLQQARATLDQIPARSFSAAEAGRLRGALERLEQEEVARAAARRAAAAQAQRPRLPAPRPSAPYRDEPLW